MRTNYSFSVFPGKINMPNYSVDERSAYPAFLFLIAVIGASIALLGKGDLSGGQMFLVVFVALILIVVIISTLVGIANHNEAAHLEMKGKIRMAEDLQKKEIAEAAAYSRNLNLLLSKSEEIIADILPNYETIAKKNITIAKSEFAENVYSPFWSKIEIASDALACFKEALNQLSFNSELYVRTLKYFQHNFPIPFPFKNSITVEKVVSEFTALVRQAQKETTFSIIWEQRRNTEVMAGGFKSLEEAISNMSYDITEAINDFNQSLQMKFDEMSYRQLEQSDTLNKCLTNVSNTLYNMDNKLYYIQWNRKPQDNFRHIS
jgi:murein L,D-transpeptidase YcbB/YkuD